MLITTLTLSAILQPSNLSTRYKIQTDHPTITVQASNADPHLILPQFYCPPCTLTSASTPHPLSTTHKNQRKSARASAQNRLDYANLDAHLPADPNRWLAILASRPVVEHAFRHFTAAELTDEWLWGEESMKEPFVVDEEEGLGMRMPRRDLRISEVAEMVGRETGVEVIGAFERGRWRRRAGLTRVGVLCRLCGAGGAGQVDARAVGCLLRGRQAEQDPQRDQPRGDRVAAREGDHPARVCPQAGLGGQLLARNGARAGRVPHRDALLLDVGVSTVTTRQVTRACS